MLYHKHPVEADMTGQDAHLLLPGLQSDNFLFVYLSDIYFFDSDNCVLDVCVQGYIFVIQIRVSSVEQL